MKSRLVWCVVGLFLLLSGVGCEEAPPSPPSDEHVDQAAFALIPIRVKYTRPDAFVTDESARKVENALRLEYAPVECRGKHGRLAMNLIQGATRKSPDLVTRNGRTVYAAVAGVEPVAYKGCRVVGSHLAGPATMLKAFSRPAATVAEFTYQQALWLAIREPWGLDAGALSTSFYTFLAENLGALPPEDRTRASLTVIDLDRSFNPCTKDSKKPTADNQVFFKCLAGVSYANTLGFAKYRDKILGFIAKTEGDYLKRLGTVAADDPETDGIDVALTVAAGPAKLALVAASPVGLGADTPPPAEVADAAGAPPAALAALGADADKARFVSMLGLRLTKRVSDVVSASNPRLAALPPPISADQASAAMGTDAGGGWRKVGDAFVTMRDDHYVTARAIGGDYRTAAWQVTNGRYWTSDLARSMWLYAPEQNQFLRGAYNGNPLDARGGKGLAKLPKGWKTREGGSLADAKNQIWSWNTLLGAFVKQSSSNGSGEGQGRPRIGTSAARLTQGLTIQDIQPSPEPATPPSADHVDIPPLPPRTGIDAFRDDYNLQGTAAQQRALADTPGVVQHYGAVALALPYGQDLTTAGGANDRWRDENQCGDMARNAAADLNALGINAGQVAVTDGGDTSHAVVWMRNGTTADGQETYAFYDPQTRAFAGNNQQGYLTLDEGVKDLGQLTNGYYAEMRPEGPLGETSLQQGEWHVATERFGRDGAVRGADDPPFLSDDIQGLHESNGVDSTVHGAGQGTFEWYADRKQPGPTPTSEVDPPQLTPDGQFPEFSAGAPPPGDEFSPEPAPGPSDGFPLPSDPNDLPPPDTSFPPPDFPPPADLPSDTGGVYDSDDVSGGYYADDVGSGYYADDVGGF